MKRTLAAAAIFIVVAASSALAYQEPVPVTQEPTPTPQESAPAPLPPAPSEPEITPSPAPETVAPVAENASPLPPAATELSVAGRVVMRVRTGAGGQTAEQRVSNLQQRIGPILILPELKASDFQIRQPYPGATAAIYVRDLLLVTVDPDLAQTNNTSIEGLAGRWVQNLCAVLPLVEVASVKPATATAAAAAQPPIAEPVPAAGTIPTPAQEPTPSAEPVPAPSTTPATP